MSSLPTSWRRRVPISDWWLSTPIRTRRWSLSHGWEQHRQLCSARSQLVKRRLIDLAGVASGAKEFLTQPLRIEDLLGALGRISERRGGQGDNRLVDAR